MPESSLPRGPAGSAAADWNLAAVQKLLWHRRWLIVAVAAEVFLLTGLVTFLRTPLYEASARVLIERATPKVMEAEDVVPMVWNEFEIQRFYQTQYLLIRDPAVLRNALKLNGVRDAILASVAPKDERRDDGTPPPDDAALARYIRDRLTIEQLEYSDVVRVAFRHPSADVAANVVNAVVEAYRAYFVKSGMDSRQTASKFLDGEIETATVEVRTAEAELNKERSTILTVLPSSGSEVGKARLESLDAALTESKARRAKAEAKVLAYRRSSPQAVEGARDNPQVVRYQEHLAQMKRELAELEGRVGPEWPRLGQLRSAIAETEKNLADTQRTLYEQELATAQAEFDRADKDVAKLGALLQDELQSNAVVQSNTSNFDNLRSVYEQKKAALDRLLARREEVAVAANLTDILQKQITIVDTATPPRSPAVPRVKLNLALGLAFGLFLGIAAAFVAEALDNKVRSTQQVQELTRLPILGSIPRVDAGTRPRLVFSRKKRVASPVVAARQHDAEESFRALRSSLLLSHAGHPPRWIMVTSALPGEGKSTIAVNIGRTLASFGSRVLLIDADLRHPRLHRAFKIANERGLANIMAAASTRLEELVAATRYPNLFLLPGGPCPPDPATLLRGERFTDLVRYATEQMHFEFVIVDTPPTLVFADAYNIVPSVEAVALVARAMQTPKDALRQAAESLRKMNAPLIGAILNGEITEEHSGSYYRYYHYRKGYYGKPQQQAPPSEGLTSLEPEAEPEHEPLGSARG
ncbi:MAG: polysaccharide biosynthesis tyrosine autokinase [Acidobacteria bacterium]|nr:polysaccharide biosynthesis tyrosine autokinase [Acidobacteriota bacterium]